MTGTADYSAPSNWQGGVVDDRFTGFTLPGALTVAIAEDRMVSGDLYLNQVSSASSNLTLQAASGQAPKTLTMGGKLFSDTGTLTGKTTIGDGLVLKFTKECEIFVAGSTTSASGPAAIVDLRGQVVEGVSGLNFRKSGTGVLYIGSPMSYSGTTYFDDGRTNFNADEVIPDLSPLVLGNGLRTVFDLNNHVETVGSLAGGGAASGNILLGNTAGTLIVGGNNQSTQYAGIIQLKGTLCKAGAGTMTLQNTSTYMGALKILGGTLEFGGFQNGATAVSATTTNITSILLSSDNTSNGARLWLNNGVFSSGARINDTAPITLAGGGGAIRMDGNSAASVAETMGALTLSSGLTQIEVNNVTGRATTLTFGALTARSPGSLLNFVGAGGTLGATGNNPTVKFAATPSLGISGATPASGSFGAWATVGDNDWAAYSSTYGVLAMSSYTPWTATNTSATTHYAASGDVTRNVIGSALTLKFNPTAAQTIQFNADVTLADRGGVLKTGAVKTTIQGSGTLKATNELVIGAADPAGMLSLLAPLNITGTTPCLTKFGKGRVQIDNFSAAPNWFANTVTIGGGALEIVERGNDTLSGSLVGPAGAVFAKSGSGTLTLTSANPSFGGRFEIGGGELKTAGTVTTLKSMLTADRLRNLTSNANGVGGYLTLAASDAAFVLPAGAEWSDQNIGLKIIDSVLGGADVSFENYAVWNRELFINQGATVRVAAAGLTLNGKLGGHGTLVGGRVTSLNVVAPYASIGSLTVAGDFTVANVFSAKLDPGTATADTLLVGGDLQLGDLSALELSPNAPLDDPAYVLASYGTLSGRFNQQRGVPEGYAIDYAYNGNQIALVAVPEPTTLAMLAPCAAIAAAWVLRRRPAKQ